MHWGQDSGPLMAVLPIVASLFGYSALGQTMDNLLATALGNCDRQAEQQIAAASAKKPIAPTDLLAWPLLMNDLAIRRQQEADQPRLLADIEQQRQQCRLAAETAAAQRVQEARKQENERNQGYQRISVETFALDGKELAAKAAKVSISGAYLGGGNISLLFNDTRAVILATRYPNLGEQPKVPLLVDSASREFRKRLLSCRSSPGSAQVGCPITVLGRVTMCTFQNELGATRDAPCLNVEDGR